MSGQGPDRPAAPPAPPAPPTLGMGNTPNAEKYVLEADAMRRRQLRSALLHGSRRTWREHGKVWPAVAVGLVVAAVIVAGIAVKKAIPDPESPGSTPTPTAPVGSPSSAPDGTSPPRPSSSTSPGAVPSTPVPSGPSASP